MKRKIVIWGASGHARVVSDMLRALGGFEIVGFLDDFSPEKQGKHFCGYPILGGREQLDDLYAEGIRNLIFGFGDCKARLQLSAVVHKKGFELVTAIHPHAAVSSDAQIGRGSVIAAGSVVAAGCRIADNVIINTSASVDHETIVEEAAHIGPGVRLGGCVEVGKAAWIGIGAVVKDRIVVGAGSIIGAGSLVLKNIPEDVVAYGSPAKVMKK